MHTQILFYFLVVCLHLKKGCNLNCAVPTSWVKPDPYSLWSPKYDCHVWVQKNGSKLTRDLGTAQFKGILRRSSDLHSSFIAFNFKRVHCGGFGDVHTDKTGARSNRRAGWNPEPKIKQNNNNKNKNKKGGKKGVAVSRPLFGLGLNNGK